MLLRGWFDGSEQLDGLLFSFHLTSALRLVSQEQSPLLITQDL